MLNATGRHNNYGQWWFLKLFVIGTGRSVSESGPMGTRTSRKLLMLFRGNCKYLPLTFKVPYTVVNIHYCERNVHLLFHLKLLKTRLHGPNSVNAAGSACFRPIALQLHYRKCTGMYRLQRTLYKK